MGGTVNLCPCRGAGMYLVEEDGYSVMRVCDCPAGLRRKEYLRDDARREGLEGESSREEAEGKLPF